MSWALTQSTAPTEEPITLVEAKLHLRVSLYDDDNLITGLIKAARAYAETVTRRQFVNATYQYKLDAWPNGDIRLPRPPLSSVTSITYVDVNGDVQTAGSSLYDVDTDTEPGRISLAYDQIWPTARDQNNTILITYVAGYGAASAVPESLKQAIKLLVGHWYENREGVITGTISAPVAFAVNALLQSEKILEVA